MEPIIIKARAKTHPHEEYEIEAFLPFVVFGEKLAVTRGNPPHLWRATHIATGAVIPGTLCEFKDDVPDHTARFLTELGEAKFKEAIKRIEEQIASANNPT